MKMMKLVICGKEHLRMRGTVNPLYRTTEDGGDIDMGMSPESRRPDDPGPQGRSFKKAKGIAAEQSNGDKTMGEAQSEGVQAMEEVPKSPERRLVSYRDLVAGANARESVESFSDDEENWNGENLSDDEEDEDGALKKKLGPGDDICKKERIELCRPWRKSLIIKVLGKEVGYRFLLNRLQKMWNPAGKLDMIDFKNNFFLVMLSSIKDLRYALQEGPWVVAGHYLLCQRWKPEFNPYENHIRKQAVWIRVPGLPIEYYKKPILWEVRNEIGKTLRVDIHTIDEEKFKNGVLSTERGQFARICVEVDLRKPLLAKVRVRKSFYNVEYEGLPLICFDCGRYGHWMEHCPNKIQPPNMAEAAKDRTTQKMQQGPIRVSEASEKEGENFGPWMIAQRNGQRSRNQRDTTQKNPASNNHAVPDKGFERSKENSKSVSGNRFGVMVDLEEEVNGNLDDLVENTSQSINVKGAGVARNLNRELEGHRVVPNNTKAQKSPHKQKAADPSGSRNHNQRGGDMRLTVAQGPTRDSHQIKAKSPIKNRAGGRNKDKGVMVGPLRESRSQNTIPKSGSRDNDAIQKAATPVPPIKSGPDIQQREISNMTAEELIRLMRYERKLLADQGVDSLDDLPVLRVHNDGF